MSRNIHCNIYTHTPQITINSTAINKKESNNRQHQQQKRVSQNGMKKKITTINSTMIRTIIVIS